jgi:polyhydroxyalkanoate synthesis regulator protein
VLTDLVRSYTSQAASVVPEFLQASFEMLRDGQSKAFENLGKTNPLTAMPGFDAMRAQQAAFFKAMTGGIVPAASAEKTEAGDDLGEIKSQLAALQEKLSKMGK